MGDKLRSRRGETLTETLAAVLIVALSSVVMLTMTMSALRIDQAAEEMDRQLQEEQAAAERQDVWELRQVEVRVGGNTYAYEVHRTGGGGKLASYAYVREETP